MLNRVPDQVVWVSIAPDQPFALGPPDALCCTPVSLGSHFPAYVSETRQRSVNANDTLLGLIVESNSGRKLGYFPAVPELTPALLQWLSKADVVLFDGTFWSDDELSKIRGTGPSAREIGHVPVSGEHGSLKSLSGLQGRKIYVHINNTNPMLDESSPEYREVCEAGWEIAEDGWEFEL
jgi:pyrroloquinoline quinone biosynthesis protein B